MNGSWDDGNVFDALHRADESQSQMGRVFQGGVTPNFKTRGTGGRFVGSVAPLIADSDALPEFLLTFAPLASFAL